MNDIVEIAKQIIADLTIKSKVSSDELEKVLKFFKKNKISLKSISEESSNNIPLIKSTMFQKYLSNELIQYNNWRDEFLYIKSEWDKENIKYIFHKSSGEFPYLSDNLDVLVKQEDFLKAGQILLKLGYTNLRNIQEEHKEFYRKFDGERAVCPIHLHSRVCWNVPYEDNIHLWKNYRYSETDNIVFYPSNDDCILINLAHCFLEDHQIKIYDLLIIKKCLVNNNWEYIYETADKLHWRDSLHTSILILNELYERIFDQNLFDSKVLKESEDRIKSKRWISKKIDKIKSIEQTPLPFNIPHLWTRIHTSLRILRDNSFGSLMYRIQIIITTLIDGFIHNKLKIKSHAPLFIVLSGVDGSGKTSHIKTLFKNHKTCDIKSNVYWSRSGSFPIIKKLLSFIHIFRRAKSNIYSTTNKIKKNKTNLFLWRWINCLEMIFLYFYKIRIPLFFGKSIIADRYIYDSIIDMEILNKTMNFDRLSYRLVKKFTPHPDVIFYLDVNIDTILRRGTDEAKKHLIIQRKYYKQQFDKLGNANIVTIDNNGDFNKINSSITNLSLTKLFAKHPNKLSNYKVTSFRYK